MPSIDVVRRGISIRSTTKLGDESSGVLKGRNFNQNSTLSIATTRVVGIPQMVFTNPIMANHGNRIANRPLMSSMVVIRCKLKVSMSCIQEENTKNQLL